MTYKLILLRHGHSEWNAKNLFTGWVDVDLNDQGRAEAVRGGELLVENNILPDILYTSLLKRAINTANMRWTRRTAAGSRSSATGASTSATTARCRARTRPRPSPNTAKSSS